jgi:hypothetical protein
MGPYPLGVGRRAYLPLKRGTDTWCPEGELCGSRERPATL